MFVKWDGRTVWYGRDKHEGVNHPIEERDPTGYLVNVWRFDRVDATTQEKVPRLNIQVRADKTTSSRPALPPTSPAPFWQG